ncbi:MAG: hypothetical protein V4456_15085 [Bacteroidota bacterium]
MKIKLFFFVLLGLLLIDCTVVHSQSTNPLRTKIGPVITQDAFTRMVKETVIKMKNGDRLKDSELIRIVRIDNTIEMNELNQATKENKEFKKWFDSKYYKLVVKRLHGTLGRGMSYYFEKYKVYWGGYPDSNSIFNIKN